MVSIHERLDALAIDVTAITNVKFDYRDYRQESVALFRDFVGDRANLGNPYEALVGTKDGDGQRDIPPPAFTQADVVKERNAQVIGSKTLVVRASGGRRMS